MSCSKKRGNLHADYAENADAVVWLKKINPAELNDKISQSTGKGDQIYPSSTCNMYILILSRANHFRFDVGLFAHLPARLCWQSFPILVITIMCWLGRRKNLWANHRTQELRSIKTGAGVSWMAGRRKKKPRQVFAELRRQKVASDEPAVGGIGTLAEFDLHAQIKKELAGSTGEIEVKLGRYFIDVRQGEQLIEIQTRGFAKLRKKLSSLIEQHPIRLVHPISTLRTLCWYDAKGNLIRTRRSPARGRWEDVFFELLSIPQLLNHERFSLEVLLIHEEEWRTDRAKKRRWGQQWTTVNRRLVAIVDRVLINTPSELISRLGIEPACAFTNKDLSARSKLPVMLAQRITYTLRKMEAIALIGKRGREHLFLPCCPPTQDQAA